MSSGLSGVVRSDVELPDEILSVIPTDPFEQLDLAKKITSMAIASKVSNLEAEVVELRQKLQEAEIGMLELEAKAFRFQRAFRETDSRLKIVLHDNVSNSVYVDPLHTIEWILFYFLIYLFLFSAEDESDKGT